MGLIQAALGIADSLAGVTGLLDRPFDTAALLRKAQDATGLTDFGDVSFREPLERLLDACAREARLSIVGRFATCWDVVRFLSNLLWIEDAARRTPALRDQPIETPIFITGLPRSGTTFLHRLFLLDDANRAPQVWETIFPSPASGPRDERIARVAGQLKAFERLAPEFRSLHPLEATSPQECSEITSHLFRSLRFDTTYLIPSYRQWLDADPQRNLPAYRFHRRFLQFLQHTAEDRRQWVLKCPEHLFALDAIRTVYPDARIVFVHRDPLKVLLSQAQLTEVLRRPFTRHLDPTSLGADESARWLGGCRNMIDAAAHEGFREPICHVHHLDLIAEPVATVDRIYRHFGLSLQTAAAEAIRSYVRARPNGGYGEHHYDFADHGLDAATERERFRPYTDRFGIPSEAGAAGGRRRPGGKAPQPVRSATSQQAAVNGSGQR